MQNIINPIQDGQGLKMPLSQFFPVTSTNAVISSNPFATLV